MVVHRNTTSWELARESGRKKCSRMSSFCSSVVLEELHLLSVEWRIRFKIFTLTEKAIHIGSPPYLVDLLQHRAQTHNVYTLNDKSGSITIHYFVLCYHFVYHTIDSNTWYRRLQLYKTDIKRIFLLLYNYCMHICRKKRINRLGL